MKTIFTLTVLLGLLFPSLAIADLQSECGQYFNEYIGIGREIGDFQQFQRENQAELNRFPPGKLSSTQLEEHRRLREQGTVLRTKERDLQNALRQVGIKVTNCVEKYKQIHRQGARSRDDDSVLKSISDNYKQQTRNMGIDPSPFSW
jgi:hypothetical protein